MDETALLLIDVQQECFAPVGKLMLPGIEQVIVSGFMTQMCCDTTTREAAHLNGFLAQVTTTDAVIR
jgi:nicotinamidase-related amidase